MGTAVPAPSEIEGAAIQGEVDAIADHDEGRAPAYVSRTLSPNRSATSSRPGVRPCAWA